jgi:signal transduction histidine kinase
LGETFFILMQGKAEVYIRPDNEAQILVRTIRPPSYFGEMALLGQISRSATVKALTHCKTLEIDRETFVSVVEDNRVFLKTMAHQINDHLDNNDQTIIAELHQKNQALQNAYGNLAEQERLRTEFITTISHELRTPLTAVQGFLHLINNGAAQGELLQVAMASVNRNVEKMVQLTNNLLVLYEMHLSEPTLTNLSVADLLIEAMQAARAIQENYLTPIELTMFPGATRLQGDKSSLSLVLRALIENALKFSPNRTSISISVSKPISDEICIEIADQGVGMTEDVLEHIFDPFFRGSVVEEDQIFSGLGIGLAISQFIMNRHGGRIEAESKPGKGSVFRLYLPHAKPQRAGIMREIVEKSLSKPDGFRAGVYAVAANA